jgi:hypothetical protein
LSEKKAPKGMVGNFKKQILRQEGSFDRNRKLQLARQWKYLRSAGGYMTLKYGLIEEANLNYVTKEWKFESRAVAFRAAINFLAVVTRLGLKRIDTNVCDALIAAEEARQAELAEQEKAPAMPPERDPT